jgi:tryptophanase
MMDSRFSRLQASAPGLTEWLGEGGPNAAKIALSTELQSPRTASALPGATSNLNLMKAAPASDPALAGETDYFRHFLNRTIMLLGEEAVQTLRRKRVAIAGCGGQGGATCLMLARMGVSHFILADPKPFDEPDINRQWGAQGSTLGRNKAEVYAEMLQEINPAIESRLFTSGITDSNVDEFLEGADLLIDCLDISVSGALRKEVFSKASARGMHIFTGAMLGFGGMVAGSYPGGLPLELVASVEDTAIGGSTLPRALRELFVPDHLDRLEQSLPIHRAPSIAVSPGLLAMVLSVESVLALVGNTIAGWRPPVCLPRILFVDLLRMTFQVVHLDDLLLERSATAKAHSPPAEPAHAVKVAPQAVETREALLQSVGYNTNLLPQDAIGLDLITDNWGEIPSSPPASSGVSEHWTEGSTEQPIQGLYGYRYVVPVNRGRFAEALLGKVLAGRRGIVASNSLFPTTRFHLETNGFVVEEIPVQGAFSAVTDIPFKGDIDLDRLKEMLAGPDGVAVIYLELCVNAIGGHPISMACLRRTRNLALEHGVPLFLDGARAFENAVMIRDREEGYAERTLVSIVREMTALSDGCAASCSKDFPTRIGGFVAFNRLPWFQAAADLTLAFGDGLDRGARLAMRGALARDPEGPGGSLGRVRQVERLWKALRALGVPVTTPSGGHGIFVDACAMLPTVQPDQFPAHVLANELFISSGIRGMVNFASPEQKRRDVHLLRLAIPVSFCQDSDFKTILHAFTAVVTKRNRIVGLKKVEAPPGAMAEFAAAFRPLS